MRAANSTSIGFFVVGGVLAFIAAIFLFTAGSIGGSSHTFVLHFNESVHGLDVGAPVKMRGVRVGQVRKIAPYFDMHAGKVWVPVTITLQGRHFQAEGEKNGTFLGGFFRKFRPKRNGEDSGKMSFVAGLVASLQPESFVTGKFFVDLSYLPTDAIDLRSSIGGVPEIPTRPSDLRSLNDQLTAIAEGLSLVDYAAIGRALEQILSHMAVVEWRDLAKSVAVTSQAIGETLGGEEIRRAIHNFDAVCQNFEELTRRLSDGTVFLVGEARQACRELATAAESVKNFLDDGASIPLEFLQFLRQTGTAVQAVQGFFELLDQKPNALLFGRTNREKK